MALLAKNKDVTVASVDPLGSVGVLYPAVALHCSAALARLQAAWSDHGGPARDVTIERRTGRATSELVRYRVTETAGR